MSLSIGGVVLCNGTIGANKELTRVDVFVVVVGGSIDEGAAEDVYCDVELNRVTVL